MHARARARVRPRLRARAAWPRGCRARAGARSSRSPTRCSRSRCRRTRRPAHVDAMRRLLHVAMTRARRRLVLAYPRDDRARRAPAAVPVRRGGARGARRRVGGRARRSCSAPARRCTSTYRLLRDELLTTVQRVGWPARRAALRHRPRRLARASCATSSVLKLAALMERPRGGRRRRGAARDQRAAAAGGDGASSARSSRPRRWTSTCSTPSATTARGRGAVAAARRAVAGAVPAAARRRAGARRPRDIETYRTVPAEVQVRARLPDPEASRRSTSASGSSSTRCSSASTPGGAAAGTLRRAARAARRPAGAAAASATPRRSASCAARRPPRCCATTSASRPRSRRAGLVRARVPVQAGPAPAARPRRPRRPAARRRLRADRLQDRPAEVGAQLREDVQLSLYAVGAREAWQLEAARQAYYYVLDDEKVPVERRDESTATGSPTRCSSVADGILAQGFEPTPSYSACSMCDYRIACPAAER